MKGFLLVLLVLPVIAAAPAISPTTEVTPLKDNKIVIASFNIIHFNENRQNVSMVAKVIANFDLCGIVELETVEVMEMLDAELESITGESWDFVASPETGRGKKIERFAYIWRSAKVRLNGEAYNLPDKEDIYCNEPYVAYFKSGNFDFGCVLVHVLWFPPHKKAAEARRLAVDFKNMFDTGSEKDLILMGDFNYNHDHKKMGDIGALKGIVKIEPRGVRTRVGKHGEMEDQSIDHIFVFNTTVEWTKESGAFYFVPVLYENKTDWSKAYNEVSDHLPVWAAFSTDLGDDD